MTVVNGIWKGNNMGQPDPSGTKTMTMFTKHLRVLGWSVKTTITARCQETLMFEVAWGKIWVSFLFEKNLQHVHDFDLGFHPLGNQCYFSVRNCWWLPPFSQGWRFWRPLNFSSEGEAHVVLALHKLSLEFGWPFQSHMKTWGIWKLKTNMKRLIFWWGNVRVWVRVGWFIIIFGYLYIIWIILILIRYSMYI